MMATTEVKVLSFVNYDLADLTTPAWQYSYIELKNFQYFDCDDPLYFWEIECTNYEYECRGFERFDTRMTGAVGGVRQIVYEWKKGCYLDTAEILRRLNIRGWRINKVDLDWAIWCPDCMDRLVRLQNVASKM